MQYDSKVAVKPEFLSHKVYFTWNAIETSRTKLYGRMVDGRYYTTMQCSTKWVSNDILSGVVQSVVLLSHGPAGSLRSEICYEAGCQSVWDPATCYTWWNCQTRDKTAPAFWNVLFAFVPSQTEILLRNHKTRHGVVVDVPDCVECTDVWLLK